MKNRKLSLTEDFVKVIERKILLGEWKTGQKVPTLRELALDMGISRSVVNAGIIELTNKGYLKTVPRKWTEVTDWRRHGTLAVLNGIMENDIWDDEILTGLFDSRMLVECDSAHRAANNRSDEDLKILSKIIEDEAKGDNGNINEVIRRDLLFHHTIAVASGNIVYPLILKGFEHSNNKLMTDFYSNPEVYNYVNNNHKRMYEAIKERDSHKAQSLMRELLTHGEKITRLARKGGI